MANKNTRAWEINPESGLKEGCRRQDSAEENAAASKSFSRSNQSSERKALRMYKQKRRDGDKPSISTLFSALKACGKMKDLKTGRRIHKESGEEEEDISVQNTLVDMYAKCGSMAEALQVFDRMRLHDVVSWTALIAGYAQNGSGEMSLKFFQRMQEQGFVPNARTFVAAIKGCAEAARKEEARQVQGELVKQRSLERGMAIQSLLTRFGIDYATDVFLASSLVDMYTQCGSLTDAYGIFQRTTTRDVILWSSLIMAFAQAGEGEFALELFSRMQKEVGLIPNAKTFLSLLKACAVLAVKDGRSLEKCKLVHSWIARSVCKSDIIVLNSLLDTYVKCGSLIDARRVFDRMKHRDVVSWTALIMGYAQIGEGDSALDLLRRMQEEENCKPNSWTFVAALKACTDSSLDKGRAVHSEAIRGGFEHDTFVGNALMDMYARCGSLPEACEVFEKMQRRDIVSWNTIITEFAQSGEASKALQMFDRLNREGRLNPNARTFVAALKACGEFAVEHEEIRAWCLGKGREIHSQARKGGHGSNIFVGSSLVVMYVKCGSLIDARQVFEAMRQHDLVTWTAMLTGYVQSGECGSALECFRRMVEEEGLKPDEKAFVAVLRACCAGFRGGRDDEERMRFVTAGRSTHSHVVKAGVELELPVANGLVEMYGNFGHVDVARDVFDRMRKRDAVTWSGMLLGYARSGNGKAALAMFERMGLTPDARCFAAALKACAELAAAGDDDKSWCLERGRALHAELEEGGHESETTVANGLLEMYGKCGSMKDALIVFEGMKQRDTTSWNWMILGYAHNDRSQEALDLFQRLPQPDSRSYYGALKACGNLSALEIGREIHEQVRRSGFDSDELVVTSLVDFYGKCGEMVESQKVFDGVTRKNSLVVWNSLITGYVYQGDADKVFELVEKMKEANVVPDGITYLCVLNACNHGGLVDRGKEFLERMKKDGLVPGLEHYTCIVDLLGRRNCLDEAVKMVKEMPVKADKVIWTSVLSAAGKWKNVELAKLAFEALVEMEGKDSATYVLMGNTYAHVAGSLEEH